MIYLHLTNLTDFHPDKEVVVFVPISLIKLALGYLWILLLPKRGTGLYDILQNILTKASISKHCKRRGVPVLPHEVKTQYPLANYNCPSINHRANIQTPSLTLTQPQPVTVTRLGVFIFYTSNMTKTKFELGMIFHINLKVYLLM